MNSIRRNKAGGGPEKTIEFTTEIKYFNALNYLYYLFADEFNSGGYTPSVFLFPEQLIYSC